MLGKVSCTVASLARMVPSATLTRKRPSYLGFNLAAQEFTGLCREQWKWRGHWAYN